MKIIEPYTEILTPVQEISGFMKDLELFARVCYKSEDKIGEGSAEKILSGIIVRGHESVIEHKSVTVRFVCDRGISHELVRHRLGSYSQESSRYANYSKDKFGNEVTFISPDFWDDDSDEYLEWYSLCNHAESVYLKLLQSGAKPEEARSILPNSTKTEIVVTYNLRQWRHFFKMRCSVKAHPQMRQLTIPLLEEFKKLLPVIFGDIRRDDNEKN